ncbi:oxidoreductase CipA, putative [Glarea lozoyensis ATCC 20868]|uniref:Oxidoreductase CipA, putative n=1 Tax=Glarea lozoyensis (strain ATCC 20868 / MF5171) TaxID=1116229 RepID=S3E365_GLAL2|nr:oxidoreductase CipA, putative [Glarea lozoyensis ATCC 20868]EPE32868.1 oxidoreductase CipA, putative [Glarea lozoyensis ATCC 20868]
MLKVFGYDLDILDSVDRVPGDADTDWEITYEPSADRWKRGVEQLQRGDREGFTKSMFTRVFYLNGDGD